MKRALLLDLDDTLLVEEPAAPDPRYLAGPSA